MDEERREEERVTVSLEVFWEGGSGLHPARISDISLGGCYLDTIGSAEPGEVIGLTIKLPDGERLTLRGEVAFRIKNLGFSVCFTFLTDEEQRLLTQLINR
ncbi:MAG: hypothetical protein QOF02_3485 [Blastocatellia bacterium]|jgi:hypothetical protein|nr:hypothetical protein [Blastocatellia bacterium]